MPVRSSIEQKSILKSKIRLHEKDSTQSRLHEYDDLSVGDNYDTNLTKFKYRSRSKHALKSAEGAMRNKRDASKDRINSQSYLKICKESRNRL